MKVLTAVAASAIAGAGVVLYATAFRPVLQERAVLSDRLKKRRARSRAGLEDADTSAAVRAMFLYAMRWLEQGGLTAENRPWASRAAEIGTLYGDGLRRAFEEAVPLWREAAYSGHALSEAQRAAMRSFLDAAMTAARGKLTRRQRFRVRYIEAL